MIQNYELYPEPQNIIFKIEQCFSCLLVAKEPNATDNCVSARGELGSGRVADKNLCVV